MQRQILPLRKLRIGISTWAPALLRRSDNVPPVDVIFLAPANIPKFAPIAEPHPQLPLIIDPMNLTLDIAKNGTIKNAIDDVAALESAVEDGWP